MSGGMKGVDRAVLEQLIAILQAKADESHAAYRKARQEDDTYGVEYHDGRASAYEGAIAEAEALLSALSPQLQEQEDDTVTRVAPLKAGVDGQDLSRRSQRAEVTAAKLTDAQMAILLAVDEVLANHHATFDDMCEAYAQAFDLDAQDMTDPADEHVQAVLRSAATTLRHAGMDWYVSTK